MRGAAPAAFVLGVLMGTGTSISAKVNTHQQSSASHRIAPRRPQRLHSHCRFSMMALLSPTRQILFGIQGEGIDGSRRFFEKPLLLTWVMFLAMTLALPLQWLRNWFAARGGEKGSGGGGLVPVESDTTWRSYFLMLVPTVFDLLATALSTAGLMFTTVSVFQLVRCSVMIFTALMKASLLRQKLKKYMWIGILVNTLGSLTVKRGRQGACAVVECKG